MSNENPIIIDHEDTPNKESLKTKVSNFYKKHKKTVIASGVVVGGVVTTAVLKSLTSDNDTREDESTEDDATDLWIFTGTTEEVNALSEAALEMRESSDEDSSQNDEPEVTEE